MGAFPLQQRRIINMESKGSAKLVKWRSAKGIPCRQTNKPVSKALFPRPPIHKPSRGMLLLLG